MLILCVFFLAFLLEATRRQRKETLALEYTYRLFALRDELRQYAIENQQAAQSWLFMYLDSTTAKSIRLLAKVNIWYLFGLLLTYQNDQTLEKLRGKVEEEYSKPENQKYKEVEEKLIQILGEYIVSRHILLLIVSFLSALPVLASMAAIRSLKDFKKRSLELVVEAPETSTLYRYAPA